MAASCRVVAFGQLLRAQAAISAAPRLFFSAKAQAAPKETAKKAEGGAAKAPKGPKVAKDAKKVAGPAVPVAEPLVLADYDELLKCNSKRPNAHLEKAARDCTCEGFVSSCGGVCVVSAC